ncbi:MAG: hypothetical protein JSU86_04475 [Phycisphaerales bacterium]|nr:MAG: hypothetical protein JSU86_04475 [Phycisphaerales bacterium]
MTSRESDLCCFHLSRVLTGVRRTPKLPIAAAWFVAVLGVAAALSTFGVQPVLAQTAERAGEIVEQKVYEELGASADGAAEFVPAEPPRPSMDKDLVRAIWPDYQFDQQRPVGVEAPAEVKVVRTSFEHLRVDAAGRLPAAPPVITSFQGTIDNFTFIPPDTNGAVGPNHVAELLNNGWQVFNRTGGVVLPLISLQQFWSSLGSPYADRPFDPKLLYDQYTDRWIATADSNSWSVNSYALVGISANSDPTGAWSMAAYRADATGTYWADFPGFGVDASNIYITNNMYRVSDGAWGSPMTWVVNKANLADFAAIPDVIGSSTLRPCHSFDPTVGGWNYILSQGWSIGPTRRFLSVQRVAGVGAAAMITDLGFIEVDTYEFSHAWAPQLNCSVEIDTNDPRLLNAVLRNEKVWTTHSVGVSGKAEVSWYEFDPTLAGFSAPYAWPIQQGRVRHPYTYYFFPSIAVNKDECIALGFAGSDASIYPSGYYTIHDPTVHGPGITDAVGLLKAGEGPYWKDYGSGRNRWGDYSSTEIDPVDDATFWTVQEYSLGAVTPCVNGDGRWATWWGKFECDGTEPQCPPTVPPAQPAGEDGYEKIRYISMEPGNPERLTALRVTMNTIPPPYSGFSGTKCWVGEPATYCENAGVVSPPCPPATPTTDFVGASLGGTPHCMDWSTVGVLHVSDDDIVPNAVYDVQAIDCDCDFGNEADYSAPLRITTSIWGDAVRNCAVYPCGAPDGLVGIPTDVTAVLDKFKNLGPPLPFQPAIIKSRADLDMNIPNRRIDISDVTFCLDAFRGVTYPPLPPAQWPGPDGCP